MIFEAGIFKFVRTGIGGGEDVGVDGFESTGVGVNINASTSRLDSAAGKFMILRRKIVFSLVVILFDRPIILCSYLPVFFGLVGSGGEEGGGWDGNEDEFSFFFE